MDTMMFSESNNYNDIRLCDFFMAIKCEKKHNERPFLIEEIYRSPDSFFQGKKVFNPKHNHANSAPELLPPENYLTDPKRYYDFQADIWTFGCIVFNMVTGVPIFNANSDQELYKIIRQGEWSKSILEARKASVNLLQLLTSCLKIEPQERITSLELITHPFFTKENDKYKHLKKERMY